MIMFIKSILDLRHGRDYWFQNAETIGQNQNGIGHVVSVFSNILGIISTTISVV